VEVQLRAFIISPLHGSKRSHLHFDRFIAGKIITVTTGEEVRYAPEPVCCFGADKVLL
jgi:hypothetical protein